MANEIRHLTSQCPTCNQYTAKQQKEPVLSPEAPTTPWFIVAQDLFMFAIALAKIWRAGDMIKSPLFSEIFIKLGSELWPVVCNYLIRYAISCKVTFLL